MFTLRFSRRFSMAHRLIHGCSVACSTPHGHNEFVTVDLVGTTDVSLDGAANMVVPFESAKKRWHRFVDDCLDHAFQLAESDPLVEIANAHFPEWKLVLTPGDPTTEMLAALCAAKCQAILNADGVALRVARVTIEETPTNTVVFEPSELPVCLHRSNAWWHRPDNTTRS